MRQTFLAIILTLFCVGIVHGQLTTQDLIESAERGIEMAEQINENARKKRERGYLIIAAMIVVVVSVTGLVAYKMHKNKQHEAKMQARLRAQHAKAEARLRDEQAQLRAEYSREYEQRKITIGAIKCTQCSWSGQWGTGMSYEQFFAGNLNAVGIRVSDRDKFNDNLSRDNRQYTCPVCNSDKWEKV